MAIITTAITTLTDLNDAIISGTQPVNPTVGTLWIDSSKSPAVLKIYKNGAWTTQDLDLDSLDPNMAESIRNVVATIGNMSNDNLLDYKERQIIKDDLTEILGKVLLDTETVLPTVTQLETLAKGSFYSNRRNALNAGVETGDSIYVDVATQYQNLKTYLESLAPIKPWNVAVSDKDKNVTVIKNTFRDKWLQYYLATEKLNLTTTESIKEAQDNLDGKINEVSLRDKTEILTGNPVFTDKSDDAVVHVGVDGKSVGGGSGKNIIHGITEFTTTITGTSYYYSPQDLTIDFASLGGKRVSFSFELETSKEEGFFRIETQDVPWQIVMNTRDFKNGRYEYTTTLPTGLTNTHFQVYATSVTSGTTLKFKNIQLELGEPTTFEPPAPSPDYPIAINSLDKNFDIVSSMGGRNYQKDFTQNIQRGGVATDGLKIIDKETIEVLFPNSTGTAYIFLQPIDKVELNEKYTYSFYVENLQNAKISLSYGLRSSGSSDYTKVLEPNSITKIEQAVDITRWVNGGTKLIFFTGHKEISLRFSKVRINKGEIDLGYAQALEEIPYDTQSPTLYKTNISLSEPLRSVGDVKDRVLLGTDGLWKTERQLGVVVFNGSEDWAMNTGSIYGDGQRFNVTVGGSKVEQSRRPIISSHFNSNIINGDHVGHSFQHGEMIFIYPPASVGTTVAELKTWLTKNNMTVVYPLETPLIEILSAEQQTKLNNIASFKGSNIVYTMAKVTPNLNARFKSNMWYRMNVLGEKQVSGNRNWATNGNLAYPLEKSLWSSYYRGTVREIVDVSTETPPFRNALHVKQTTSGLAGIVDAVIWEGAEANVLSGQNISMATWLKYQNISISELVMQVQVTGKKSDGAFVYDYPKVFSYTGTDLNWKRQTGTVKINLPTDAIEITRIVFRLGFAKSGTGEFWATGIQLETGNTLGDWSTNPNDTEEELQKTEARLVLTEKEAGLSVKKGDVVREINVSDERIKISSDKIDITGAVTFSSFDNTTKNAIDDKSTKTEAQGYAENAVNSLNINDRNLEKNSAFSDLNSWSIFGGSSFGNKLEIEDISGEKWLRIENTTSENVAIRGSNIVDLKGNTEYAIATNFYANHTGTIQFILKTFDSAGAETTTTVSSTEYSASTDVRLTRVFKTPVNAVSGYMTYRQNNSTNVFPTVLRINKPKIQKGNRATDWTPAPEDVQDEIKDVSDVANSLKDFTDTAFSDGIIQRAEAQAISEHLNTLRKENDDLSNQHNTLYANVNLTGTPKTSLYNAKVAYNTAYANLISSVNNAISGNKTTVAQKTDVDVKFTSYSTALKLLTQRLSESQTVISEKIANDLAIAKANLAEISAKAHADGKISAEETRAINDAKAKLVEAQGYANEAVNNIEIGVRNYLVGNSKEVGGTRTTNNYFGFNGLKIDFASLSGQKVTLSFDLKTSQEGGTFRIETVGSPWQIVMNTRDFKNGRYEYTTTLPTGLTNTAMQMYYTNVPVGAIFTFSNMKLEKGSKATGWMLSPEDADALVTQAQTDATNAKNSANTSTQLLADLSNDNILTPVEKKSVKKEWDIIVSEAVKIGAEANEYGVATEKTAYNTHYSSLNSYITPLLSNLNVNSSITGTNFRIYFKNYYDARQDLLNAITSKAKLLADTAQANIDGLEIGGKNLLRNSDFSKGLSNWVLNNATGSVNMWRQLVIKGTSATESRVYYDLFPSVIGQTYTVSFEANADVNNVKVLVGQGTNTKEVNITTGWKRYTVTYTANQTTTLSFWLKSTNINYLFRNIQLETGMKATDYGRSAEDVQEDIAQAQKDATSAKTKTDDWTFTGTTTIDGGKIKADTITSAQIKTGSLKADDITSGTLKGGAFNLNLSTGKMEITGTAQTVKIDSGGLTLLNNQNQEVGGFITAYSGANPTVDNGLLIAVRYGKPFTVGRQKVAGSSNYTDLIKIPYNEDILIINVPVPSLSIGKEQNKIYLYSDDRLFYNAEVSHQFNHYNSSTGSISSIMRMTVGQIESWATWDFKGNTLSNISKVSANNVTARDKLGIDGGDGKNLSMYFSRELWISAEYGIVLAHQDASGIGQSVMTFSSSGIKSWRNIDMQGYTVTGQSDRRLKKNINKTIENSLSSITKWNFVNYEWIDSEKPDGVKLGLIAQDTPELMIYDAESDIYSIDSSKQTMMNSHAIQQLNMNLSKEIELLKIEIFNLKDNK